MWPELHFSLMLLVFIDLSIVVLRVLILFYFLLTRHISEKK